MRKTIKIAKNKYEELRKSSIFFLKFYDDEQYNYQGKKVDLSKWRSIERDLNISFDAGNFSDRSLGYALCIIDKGEEEIGFKGDIIEDTINMTSKMEHGWLQKNIFVLRQNGMGSTIFLICI